MPKPWKERWEGWSLWPVVKGTTVRAGKVVSHTGPDEDIYFDCTDGKTYHCHMRGGIVTDDNGVKAGFFRPPKT